jgi:hypothetical protein
MIISPRVTSECCTDLSSLPALLAGKPFRGKTGRELAVAIWGFIVDRHEGVYHYWPATERLTDHMVYDPLKLLNCFGWTICSQNANLLAALYKAAGFEDARVVRVDGHTVQEVFYDGAWHLFDGDLQAFHRRHPPHHDEIASYHECIADPTLISEQASPSDPYYPRGKDLAKTAGLYEVQPWTTPVFDEQAHTMDFVLRPGERLMRSTGNKGMWIRFDNFDEFCQRYNHDPAGLTGPKEGGDGGRTYGNGLWTYQPKLSAGYRDFEAGVSEADGVAPAEDGAATSRTGQGSCTFEFDSPWVYTGRPVLKGTRPPREGCMLAASVRLTHPAATAEMQLAVDPDLPWQTVWSASGRGRYRVRRDLTEHVVNAYRYRLRFVFDAPEAGACVLESLCVRSAILVAPASLGRLVEGDNPLTVRFGDGQGLPTRRWIVGTNFLDAEEVARKTHRLENLRFDPDSEDRIAPADAGRDYEIVFRLDSPAGGRLVRVYAFGSVRSKAPGDPDDRVLAWWAPTDDGPWAPLYDEPVLTDPNRWHFSAQGEAALPAGSQTVYVKFAGRAGMKTAKVRAHWLDRRAEDIRPALTVEHVWQEADGCWKGHTETVAGTDRPHEYRLRCGAAPRLGWIVMEAGSVTA